MTTSNTNAPHNTPIDYIETPKQEIENFEKQNMEKLNEYAKNDP